RRPASLPEPGGAVPRPGVRAAGRLPGRRRLARPHPAEGPLMVLRFLTPVAGTLLLLGAAAAPAPEALLDEGDAAFARGDYAAAAALYERAEPRAHDPGRVALGLADAKYRLAEASGDPGPELAEAEQLYRACLDPAEPR